ncbi:hypothetical protein TgHK011_006183 [Trichoderma gracile]|nr:hypothetical protein TgHK011_006183 [Trichoderma gracile]
MPPASPFTASPFDLVINPGQRAPNWPQVRLGQANQDEVEQRARWKSLEGEKRNGLPGRGLCAGKTPAWSPACLSSPRTNRCFAVPCFLVPLFYWVLPLALQHGAHAAVSPGSRTVNDGYPACWKVPSLTRSTARYMQSTEGVPCPVFVLAF